MVITVLDAVVEENAWETLKKAYATETANMPDDIHQTFLIQSQIDPTAWRIMTQWRSREDLDEMRSRPETPPAIRIFQAANAQPKLAVWDVVTHRVNQRSAIFQPASPNAG